jgi:hypothetical protein
MLSLGHEHSSTCNGLSRRSFLRVGGLTAFGLNLPTLLAAEAAQKPQNRREISIILLWMGGGPANMDTFDMKPSAPAEYRGEYRPIATNVSGSQVCEHLPRMARQMDKVCVVKSVSHKSSVHVQADHFMLTGYDNIPVTSTEEVSALIYPSYGSVITREKGWRNGMPPYIRLGRGAAFTGAGYMGTSYDPLRVDADPNQPGFNINDVSLPGGVKQDRADRRRRMLAELDRWQRAVDKSDPGTLSARGKFYEQAYGLLTSPAAKRAFNLGEEDPKVRDRYGRHRYGQAALLARRLVEAGVRFVTVETGRWDTHQDNFKELLHEDCLPSLDVYWSALLEDLKDRGLLETTLVMWMGEFGRTPQVNGRGGRDHWGMANAICLSGAGIKMGSVVGKTDKYCTQPEGLTHSTHDLAATVYHLAGIDGTKEYLTPDGRPVLINYHGQPIAEALV